MCPSSCKLAPSPQHGGSCHIQTPEGGTGPGDGPSASVPSSACSPLPLSIRPISGTPTSVCSSSSSSVSLWPTPPWSPPSMRGTGPSPGPSPLLPPPPSPFLPRTRPPRRSPCLCRSSRPSRTSPQVRPGPSAGLSQPELGTGVGRKVGMSRGRLASVSVTPGLINAWERSAGCRKSRASVRDPFSLSKVASLKDLLPWPLHCCPGPAALARFSSLTSPRQDLLPVCWDRGC